MTERREQTLTAESADGDTAPATRIDDQDPKERPHGGGLSTAAMAAAMAPRGDGDTTGSAAAARGTTGAMAVEPLFPGTETERFHARWTSIQAGFVDEPRAAVEQADALVAAVIQRLVQVFADERSTLEGQWGQGDASDTEGLRVALRRYRSFFERLLSA